MRPTNTNSRGVARQLGTAVSLATAPPRPHSHCPLGAVRTLRRVGARLPPETTEARSRPCARGSAANTSGVNAVHVCLLLVRRTRRKHIATLRSTGQCITPGGR